MFWLSHHHEDELNRCYRVGPVHVCARCLGTYPVLFATMAVMFALKAPLAHALDWLAVALIVPAVADWAYGRFKPLSGTNAIRTLTGVGLGLGLGRTLFVHVQRPLPPALLAQLALVTVVAGPVILATYRRRRGG
jgi:uncharacterized membrane protein